MDCFITDGRESLFRVSSVHGLMISLYETDFKADATNVTSIHRRPIVVYSFHLNKLYFAR